MKVNLYGYYRENSGVQIYSKKLLESLKTLPLEVEAVEPPSILKPKALNQFLFNSIVMRNMDSDILHLTNQDDLSTILQMPQIDNLVVTVHDIFRHHGESGKLDEIRGKRYIENLEKHADKVIAISEFTKEELLENSELTEDQIRVIYQGVDSEVFRPEGSTEYGKFILHVGTEIPRKNIGGLMEVFSRLKEINPEYKLVRVGEMSKKTKKIIEEKDLLIGEDIVYEEDVSLTRLKALYNDAQKLAFPSKAEGFGRPMVEALACDTPVVAYDRKPMNEILPTNMLVDFEDEQALAEKLDSEIEGNFQEMAERFNWEKTAEETLKVYEELTDA